ncbi:MAG: biotin/lipoyl-containing protein, partial [Lysobacterales bacterium]
AASAFGRDRVLLERYVATPRHIEIQIFGDTHGNVIHLGERECSAQRRYQKVLEESPSTFLTPELRARMGAAAVAAGHAIDYVNAGTVEFIVAPDGAFYFMEINTRLQVEHPVTEMVTGLELVEWQLRVAAGEALPISQEQLSQRGHAIEVRLYAEDPDRGFLPSSGRIERLLLPVASPGVRIDAGVTTGDTVSIFYDPMIAKLIVHAHDRRSALARMAEALAASEVVGPRTNLVFLERLIRHPAIVEGRIDTGYLDRHLEEFIGDGEGSVDLATTRMQVLAAAAAVTLLTESTPASASDDTQSPWSIADGWRVGHDDPRRLSLSWRGQRFDLSLAIDANSTRVSADDTSAIIEGARLDAGWLSARIDGSAMRWRVHAFDDGDTLVLHDGTRRHRVQCLPAYQHGTTAVAGGGNAVAAPMPGRVVLLRVAVGDDVVLDQELLVMEAMKMELALKAPRAGRIESINAGVGDFVEADAVLVRLVNAS